MPSKRILVTGATGYIGAHLMKVLAEEGMTANGTDYNLRQNDISKYVKKFFAWDIREDHFGKLFDYDVIVHLAAKTMVQPSVIAPWDYYETNVVGTMKVLTATDDRGHMLYCSTGSAINAGSSPYATSKKAAEDLVAQQGNYSIARFFNVSGNSGFKKYDDSYYHLIRKLAAVVKGKFPSIEICGIDYNTPDGTAIRNYTHIDDIVSSLVRIIKNGPTNSIENLGNKTGYSVLQVVETMKKVSGVDIQVNYGPKRLGDISQSILPDQSKFFEELRTLEDQCRSALESE